MIRKACMLAAVYFALAAVLFWIIGDNWERTAVQMDSVAMNQLLAENAVVRQQVTLPMDCLEQIEITPHYNTGERSGEVTVSLYEGETLVSTQAIQASELQSDQANEVVLASPIGNAKGKTITVEIHPNQTGLSLWAGNTMNAGKFDVAVQTAGLTADGSPVEAQLVMTCIGHDRLMGKAWYWPVALALFVLAEGLLCMLVWQKDSGKNTLLTKATTVFTQYKYLLKQLVERDFRVKYKSSMLGMVWSFLNPLLTMMVYYFVFSTLFKSNVENFPVYLMSGIVLFNYFSEASNLGMGSIVGNSALITKVYMPKIIYPLSKVLSSAINLCISFIPLFVVMVISGVELHKSLLLMPVVVLFLITFTLGVSLLLATLNVYFRDTQFLWGVLLTLLNFLSPVFYPESIIPVQYQSIYHMNPMYQILYFMRTIIIGGVSPTPVTYLYCTLAAIIPLALGLWVFRKHQDKFVLHL